MFAHLLRRLSARRPARCTRRSFTLEALEGRQMMSIAAPFLVDSGTSAHRGGPLVATSSNGSSVFVWTQAYSGTGGNEILAQRFNAARAPVGPEIIVSEGFVGANSVAMDANGDFVVAYTLTDSNNHTDVVASKFNAAGTPVGGQVQVGVGTFRQYQPVVAMDAYGNFVVAYSRDTTNNNWDVFAKRYDANTNLLGVITVAGTSAQEFNPSIAMTPDGRFDISYDLSVSPADDLPQDIFVNRYSASGGLLGTSQIGPFSGNNVLSYGVPLIAMDDTGDAVITYEEYPINDGTAIEAQRISPTGSVGSPITIYNARPGVPVFPSGIAFQPNGGYSGSFAVSFEVQNNTVPVSDSGYVAVVDGSNTDWRIYAFGPCLGSSITAEGSFGFVLTFATPPDSSNATHIFGQRGSFD